MKNNIKVILGLPLVALLITSCGTASPSSVTFSSSSENTNYDFSIISPTGAPTAAFYQFASSGDFETNSTATNVAAQFATSNYDVIVFDSLKGINQITNAETPSPYKLARIITKGNYYLVSIDKPEGSEPTSADLIVNFGQNGTPDTIYKSLYPDFSENTVYVTSVSDALTVLVNGTYNQEAVDYVFIAQPALYNAMNNTSAATYGKIKIVADIQQAWFDSTGQNGFPQAGVFVRNDVYAVHPIAFSYLLDTIDEAIETSIDDPNTVVRALNDYGTSADQLARFGFNSTMFAGVQAGGANGLGLTVRGIDVNAYYTSVGLSAVSEDVFLNLYL